MYFVVSSHIFLADFTGVFHSGRINVYAQSSMYNNF